jgi:hypothetical protein
LRGQYLSCFAEEVLSTSEPDDGTLLCRLDSRNGPSSDRTHDRYNQGNRIWNSHHRRFAAGPDGEPPRRQGAKKSEAREGSGGGFEPSEPWRLGGSFGRQNPDLSTTGWHVAGADPVSLSRKFQMRFPCRYNSGAETSMVQRDAMRRSSRLSAESVDSVRIVFHRPRRNIQLRTAHTP